MKNKIIQDLKDDLGIGYKSLIARKLTRHIP